MTEVAMTSATIAAPLTIEGIRRHLTATTDRHLYLFAEVGSTNDCLRDLAGRGAREGSVVVAEAQRVGRGRLGQRWFSPAGVNIYASVLFRPALDPGDVFTFSSIASLALVDAIEGLGVPAAIKWPNDVLVGGKKVAGMLIDCGIRGNVVDYVILGAGVNVNVTTAALRAALGDSAGFATSLSEILDRKVDREALLAAWLEGLETWRMRWQREGPGALQNAWADRDILTGRRVEVRGSGSTFEGRVLGLEPSGSLLVLDALGRRHRITTEEVRLHD
jgi:BirA family transcriptional regulator, biotin operon repressor / biotin---[acetyl-CoA-carboxylase] ligase